MPTCPLCLEDLDATDRAMQPCKCNYVICGWCLNHIREQLNGLCPACRTPYEEQNFIYNPVSAEDALKEAKERATAKKERERRRKQAELERERAHAAAVSKEKAKLNLKHARIVQRNLVYVIGLSLTLAREEYLRRNDMFGRFGRILRILVNRTHTYNADAPGGPSISAYLLFARDIDASAASRGMNNVVFDGRELRCAIACLKYCDVYSKSGMHCGNANCMYAHEETAPEEDVITREEALARQLGPPPPHHLFLPFRRMPVPLPASAQVHTASVSGPAAPTSTPNGAIPTSAANPASTRPSTTPAAVPAASSASSSPNQARARATAPSGSRGMASPPAGPAPTPVPTKDKTAQPATHQVPHRSSALPASTAANAVRGQLPAQPAQHANPRPTRTPPRSPEGLPHPPIADDTAGKSTSRAVASSPTSRPATTVLPVNAGWASTNAHGSPRRSPVRSDLKRAPASPNAEEPKRSATKRPMTQLGSPGRVPAPQGKDAAAPGSQTELRSAPPGFEKVQAQSSRPAAPSHPPGFGGARGPSGVPLHDRENEASADGKTTSTGDPPVSAPPGFGPARLPQATPAFSGTLGSTPNGATGQDWSWNSEYGVAGTQNGPLPTAGAAVAKESHLLSLPGRPAEAAITSALTGQSGSEGLDARRDPVVSSAAAHSVDAVFAGRGIELPAMSIPSPGGVVAGPTPVFPHQALGELNMSSTTPLGGIELTSVESSVLASSRDVRPELRPSKRSNSRFGFAREGPVVEPAAARPRDLPAAPAVSAPAPSSVSRFSFANTVAPPTSVGADVQGVSQPMMFNSSKPARSRFDFVERDASPVHQPLRNPGNPGNPFVVSGGMPTAAVPTAVHVNPNTGSYTAPTPSFGLPTSNSEGLPTSFAQLSTQDKLASLFRSAQWATDKLPPMPNISDSSRPGSASAASHAGAILGGQGEQPHASSSRHGGPPGSRMATATTSSTAPPGFEKATPESSSATEVSATTSVKPGVAPSPARDGHGPVSSAGGPGPLRSRQQAERIREAAARGVAKQAQRAAADDQESKTRLQVPGSEKQAPGGQHPSSTTRSLPRNSRPSTTATVGTATAGLPNVRGATGIGRVGRAAPRGGVRAHDIGADTSEFVRVVDTAKTEKHGPFEPPTGAVPTPTQASPAVGPGPMVESAADAELVASEREIERKVQAARAREAKLAAQLSELNKTIRRHNNIRT